MERDTLIWFYRHYIACDADFDNPYLFPAGARDFSAFPPTFLLTAEYDPLRDEGEILRKT
jgi:acetyl esterase